MPRSSAKKSKPPDLQCKICDRALVNLAGKDPKYAAVNCATSEIVRQILEVIEYEKGVETKECFYVESSRPPRYRTWKGKKDGVRSMRNNARDACIFLDSVVSSGLKPHSVAYISTFWKELKELKDHLESHFCLESVFLQYEDRMRQQGPAASAATGSHEEHCAGDVAEPKPSTEEDVNSSAADGGSELSCLVTTESVYNMSVGDERRSAYVSCDDGGGSVYDASAGSYETESSDDNDTVDDDSEWEDVEDDADVEEKIATATRGKFVDDSDDETARLRKRLTYRMTFEIAKVTIPLNNSQTTKFLKIFKNAKPEGWDDYVTDGRLLGKPKMSYLKNRKLRKVVCALTKEDFVPFDLKKEVEREAMLRRYEETGTTIEITSETTMGDMIDFDVEKSLLMDSPGNLNPKAYIRLLERVNAARPDLLSPSLLFIVDEKKYYDERKKRNTDRPMRNLFSVRMHSDGVQIAKNSTLPEASPISFVIDRIVPFDEKTGTWDETKSIRIPSTMSAVHAVSVYHGRGSACLFQYMEHMKRELVRLSPSLNPFVSASEPRVCVDHLLTIADSIERSKRTGIR